MGDSLVAGLRPEQGSNMGQHPAESWVLAWARLCRKGVGTWPKPNQHWVPGDGFFLAECQLKAECPPGPAVCTVEGRVGGGRYTKAGCLKSTLWAEAWWPAFGRNRPGAQAQADG